MSFTLSTIDSKLSKIRPLLVETGGITDVQLSMDLGGAYELKLNITPSLGTGFDYLKQGSWDIRLTTDYGVDIAFTKNRQPQIDRQTGLTELSFYSYLWNLKYSQRLVPFNLEYDGSANDIVKYLNTTKIIFQCISDDRSIKFNTGVVDNLKLLEDICKSAGGWTFREYGIINQNGIDKVLIQYGDFSVLPTLYRANNISKSDDPFDDVSIKINSLKNNYSGDSVNYLMVLGDTGNGSDSSTVFYLNDNAGQFVQPTFPLVDKGQEINNQTAYYIQDTLADPTTNKFETFVVSPCSSLKQLYYEGISHLKKQRDKNAYSFDFTFPRIVLPGEKVRVQYKYNQLEVDGTERLLFNIDEDYTLRALKFDLAKLKK